VRPRVGCTPRMEAKGSPYAMTSRSAARRLRPQLQTSHLDTAEVKGHVHTRAAATIDADCSEPVTLCGLFAYTTSQLSQGRDEPLGIPKGHATSCDSLDSRGFTGQERRSLSRLNKTRCCLSAGPIGACMATNQTSRIRCMLCAPQSG
jgi:hypothetical protein